MAGPRGFVLAWGSAAALALASAPTAVAAPPAALEPLSFLLGEWGSAGGEGAATGTAVFKRSLQDRVLLRTSFAQYPSSSAGRPARHDDLLVIYALGDDARADYYDSEGHVIRYAVSSPAPGRAVFLSEPRAGEPRYRLSYALATGGELQGEFAIAPADRPEAFSPYLSWKSVKVAPGAIGTRR